MYPWSWSKTKSFHHINIILTMPQYVFLEPWSETRADMCILKLNVIDVYAVYLFKQLMAAGARGRLGQPAQLHVVGVWKVVRGSVIALIHSMGAGNVWEILLKMKYATKRIALLVSIQKTHYFFCHITGFCSLLFVVLHENWTMHEKLKYSSDFLC